MNTTHGVFFPLSPQLLRLLNLHLWYLTSFTKERITQPIRNTKHKVLTKIQRFMTWSISGRGTEKRARLRLPQRASKQECNERGPYSAVSRWGRDSPTHPICAWLRVVASTQWALSWCWAGLSELQPTGQSASTWDWPRVALLMGTVQKSGVEWGKEVVWSIYKSWEIPP